MNQIGMTHPCKGIEVLDRLSLQWGPSGHLRVPLRELVVGCLVVGTEVALVIVEHGKKVVRQLSLWYFALWV